jgi:AraC-like DNA-binding protein
MITESGINDYDSSAVRGDAPNASVHAAGRAAELAHFEVCNERMRRICGPYRVESDRWWEFRGDVRNFTVAGLNITDIRLSDGRVIRDPRADARRDVYSLVLQAEGMARMCQRGCEALLKPGDCTLIDSRSPSVFHIGGGLRHYSFNFSAEWIRSRFGDASQLVCRHISGSAGAGAILVDTLRSVVRNAATLQTADFADTTLHLLASVCGGFKMAPTWMNAERTMVSSQEITDYVDAHVGDPQLTPQQIATTFNVSLRQLYRITAGANCTPSALIWQRRLQRAHEMLGRTPRVPITEIAYDCGFKDGAHFSRSYRKVFGQPPRAARRNIGEANAA